MYCRSKIIFFLNCTGKSELTKKPNQANISPCDRKKANNNRKNLTIKVTVVYRYFNCCLFFTSPYFVAQLTHQTGKNSFPNKYLSQLSERVDVMVHFCYQFTMQYVLILLVWFYSIKFSLYSESKITKQILAKQVLGPTLPEYMLKRCNAIFCTLYFTLILIQEYGIWKGLYNHKHLKLLVLFTSITNNKQLKRIITKVAIDRPINNKNGFRPT